MAKSTGSGHAIRHSIICELQAGQVGKLLYGAIRKCIGATCFDAGGLSYAETQAKVFLAKSKRSRHFARHKGNLDAFVREKGALKGAYIGKGTSGQILYMDIYPLVDFTVVDFVGGIV